MYIHIDHGDRTDDVPVVLETSFQNMRVFSILKKKLFLDVNFHSWFSSFNLVCAALPTCIASANLRMCNARAVWKTEKVVKIAAVWRWQ